MDKTALSYVSEDAADDTVAYWLSRSVEERLQGIQNLREIFYGAEASARLQRVLEFVDQEDLGDGEALQDNKKD